MPIQTTPKSGAADAGVMPKKRTVIGIDKTKKRGE